MLSLPTLENGLLQIGLQTDGAAAAKAFTTAYVNYAKAATDVADNALVTSNQPEFCAQLSACFATSNGTAAQAAAAFAAAFTAFWTGATFTSPGLPAPGLSVGGTGIMVTQISSAVAFVNPGYLQGRLFTLFSTADANTPERLAAFASCLHTATTTGVSVLISGLDATPPPVGPLPTINRGFVF